MIQIVVWLKMSRSNCDTRALFTFMDTISVLYAYNIRHPSSQIQTTMTMYILAYT
jgi:hypothetical protein